jgi:large subunit ribosomal protein L13
VITLAVQGMLPKNKLGKAMAKKLKVYADAEHPHTAQRPLARTITPRGSKQTNQA